MGWGIAAFVVALLISIMLHEAGHLITAKRFGMKATQYFVGFGPTLWSFRRGETEYGVKAIPAGGFVKIVGMTPIEELDPGDEERAFWRQPAPQRLVVLVAGSATHFVIAFVLFWITLASFAVPESTTVIDEVAPCVTAVDTDDCSPTDPLSPAAAVGLQPGDRVVAFDGHPVQDWTDDFSRRVRSHRAGLATLVIERAGQRLTLHPIVQRVRRPDPDHPTRTVEVGALGLVARQTEKRLGVGAAAGQSVKVIGRSLTLTGDSIIRIPGKLPDAFRQAFGQDERDPEGLVGPVGAGRISAQAVATGELADFLVIIATLNVFIGAMNLLPLLPLDGGHVAVLLYEQARSRIARLFGRRDPGRVDVRKLLPVAQFVIIFFAGLTLLLMYADIVNPIANPFAG